ncbi:hypothetical protein PC9H_005749 [Pleurotus ostreatus]|uniref:Uncharacterized protein n=1 Tax=Pleurotus ostreatus TaxID=5322 RepID=A0A8H6ZZL1_PLEOS|nr:uncharacterized protein PC9H_005749 [Pleurotus ostreatus]KAF7433784.1 hypothetical protein PC9H_005749 [Pleurotus ostreatus]
MSLVFQTPEDGVLEEAFDELGPIQIFLVELEPAQTDFPRIAFLRAFVFAGKFVEDNPVGLSDDANIRREL